MTPGVLPLLRVAALPGEKAWGRLVAGPAVIRCALGPNGIRRGKREGDGVTPAGCFPLVSAVVRVERVGRPRASLPLRAAKPSDGWCDDAGCACYNRPVRRPFGRSHETLWRADSLYDCVVVIGYNLRPALKGRGSAIFLHVAAAGLTPTAGCVAIPRSDLLRLLPRLGPRTRILIG